MTEVVPELISTCERLKRELEGSLFFLAQLPPEAQNFVEFYDLRGANETAVSAEVKMFRIIAKYAWDRKGDESVHAALTQLKRLAYEIDEPAQRAKRDTRWKLATLQPYLNPIGYRELMLTVFRRLVSEHYKVADCVLNLICPTLPPDIGDALKSHLGELLADLDNKFSWLRGAFLCYRSSDSEYRDRIVARLEPLLQQQHIMLWWDRQILGPVDAHINRQINRMRIAVPVMTPTFGDRNSYSAQKELPMLYANRNYMRFCPIFAGDRKKLEKRKSVGWLCGFGGETWPQGDDADLFFSKVAARIQGHVNELADVERAYDEFLWPSRAA